MTHFTQATALAQPKFGGPFWERLWRLSGLNFVALFLVAAFVHGAQPQIGAPADALTAFYAGDRTRILVATVISGVNILNLMWFAAALRSTLADAGRDGWGGAVTTAAALYGGMNLVLLTVVAVLASGITGAGDPGVTSGLNGFAWALAVVMSFPQAMLVMSGAFGLWRAKLIANGLFTVGVVAVVLSLLGGTTWFGSGAWAADGLYARFLAPAVGLLWILVVSRVLVRATPDRAAW
jgi:hypothetical protein